MIGRRRKSDLRVGKAQTPGVLQPSNESAAQCCFQSVEKPGDAQGDDDGPVPPASGKAVEPRGYVAFG